MYIWLIVSNFNRLLFFESEYHDEENEKRKEFVPKNNSDIEKQQNASSNSLLQKRKLRKKKTMSDKENSDLPLLDLDIGSFKDSCNENSQVNNHEVHQANKRNTGENCILFIPGILFLYIYVRCVTILLVNICIFG